MTIWDQYVKDNDETDDYVPYTSYIGKTVRYRIHLKDGGEVWSDSIHTVESYDDNVCGDGCCNGFYITGMPNSFWPSNLYLMN